MPEGHGFADGQGRLDGNIGKKAAVFLCGVRCHDLLEKLPRDACIFTSSLADEARLRAAGFQATYTYRNQGAFQQASELALGWLADFTSRARAEGGQISEILGDTCTPRWAMSYDALFEIKDGIFESILHAVLARSLCASIEGPIHIFAKRGDQMARATADLFVERAEITWIGGGAGVTPIVSEPLLPRILRRLDMLLVHRFLLFVRQFPRRQRTQRRVALVGTSGDMAHLHRDSRGRLQLSDVYYDGLESIFDDEELDIIRVGVNSPHSSRSGWKSVLHTWRLILSGAYAPWYAYAGIGSVFQLSRDRKRYRAIVQRLDNDSRFQALFAVDGLQFYSLLRGRLVEVLPGQLASANFHAKVAERLVARQNLGLIVSVESFSNIGRTMAAALHRHGGQLWGIQGGIISPTRVTNVGFYVAALGGRTELMPDRFFSWGPHYRDLLRTFGIPDERLVVMGFNRAKRLQPRRTGGSPKQILYLTGGNALVCPYLMTSEEEDHTLRVLLDCMPVGCELVIRVHPRHSAETFRRRFAGSKVRVVAANTVALEDSLAHADLVVGKASTVLLEAGNAGCPVLMVNLAGTPDFTGFASGPAGLPYATDAASLASRLNHLLVAGDATISQKLKHFADAWCVGDASAANRVVFTELQGSAAALGMR